MLRWWTNNVFGGTGTLHVGIHDEGHVTKVRTFQADQIPALVKVSLSSRLTMNRSVEMSAFILFQDKERQIRRDLWDPNVLLGYIHGLLHFVKQQVVKPHNRCGFGVPQELRSMSS